MPNTRTTPPTENPEIRAAQSKQARDTMVRGAQDIQSVASTVDAMVLSIELMIADQKRIMQEQGASRFLRDNELWDGMATLATAIRGHMADVGKTGEAIELAGMAQERAELIAPMAAGA